MDRYGVLVSRRAVLFITIHPHENIVNALPGTLPFRSVPPRRIGGDDLGCRRV